jgi:8-oxo-dGTP diphosphatase
LPLKREAELEDFSTPMLVVAVALIDDSGDVLMQQRNFSAVHGGLWEFPGGKVEPDESPEDAVVRELAEELDVRISTAALQPVGFASGRTASPEQGGKGRARPLVILLYACREWEGIPVAIEAAGLRWLPPTEIAGLDMPPLDYPLAAALERRLAGPGG